MRQLSVLSLSRFLRLHLHQQLLITLAPTVPVLVHPLNPQPCSRRIITVLVPTLARLGPSRGPRALVSGNRLNHSSIHRPHQLHQQERHQGYSRNELIAKEGKIPVAMLVANAKSRYYFFGGLFRILTRANVGPVRCLRIVQLHRMHKSQGAMSIHQRDKQAHVVYQVRAILVPSFFSRKGVRHSDRTLDKCKT